MKTACTIVLLAQALSATTAFAPASTQRSARLSPLFIGEDGNDSGIERGVSVDQDGKSNVWAIEPKMEVESTSAEEKTKSALIAGAGLIAFAGAAGVALTNLPDPNQF
ncbi:unnamed protein product [Pseudo-nitzschia multistriata]|uniref:Uncharacterized protein n=1 Tax=Pseudo-nitzschia multistriata TaxID=183589 RepID=A0A448ZED7_9STRA|nr:unnamed protein product [Pseudo-nitzschia multistriata]